jgi:hypothetical protein
VNPRIDQIGPDMDFAVTVTPSGAELAVGAYGLYATPTALIETQPALLDPLLSPVNAAISS